MDEEIATVPTVMVKLNDGLELTEIDQGSALTLDDLIAASGGAEGSEAAAIRELAPDLTLGWAFVSVTMSDINDLIERAGNATNDEGEADDPGDVPGYEPPRFDRFFEVICDGLDAPALAEAFSAWSDVVEYAYVVEIAEDPAVVGTGNPLFDASSQGYLSAAPDGIDAAAAWSKGADGSGITFVDIEQGWFLTHEDLPQTINLLQGSNRKTSFAHGTAVLGEIVGIDNSTGIVGIAPEASAEVVSYNDDLTSGMQVQRVADRITAAAKALPFGHVMLLEIQFSGTVGGSRTLLPVESDPLVFEAIRLATKVGVVIVEAGGNGGTDLDTFTMEKGPRKGQHTLSRSNTSEFAESGAILVGAALSASSHGRASFSNFGSRIDCFAWGENIVTSGWDKGRATATNVYWGVDLKDSSGTVQFFGGTSGASPIIVGCCLLMQGLRSSLIPISGSGKLGPFSMRRVLSNAANGTASANSTDRIAVMPDFAKIISNEFQSNPASP